jgi:hypothetical protein
VLIDPNRIMNYLLRMIMKCYYVVVVLLIPLILVCNKDKDSVQHGLERLSFTVNKSLLGKPYEDNELDFSFSPPLGWEMMSQETIQQARDKLAQTTIAVPDVTVELQQFFLDKNTGASCVLSKITGVATDSIGMERLDAYAQAALSRFAETDTRQGLFVHKHFWVHQTLIMSETMVTFKLIFPQSSYNSFQLDYVIPRKFYKEKLEAIESSIGSVSSLE